MDDENPLKAMRCPAVTLADWQAFEARLKTDKSYAKAVVKSLP